MVEDGGKESNFAAGAANSVVEGVTVDAKNNHALQAVMTLLSSDGAAVRCLPLYTLMLITFRQDVCELSGPIQV